MPINAILITSGLILSAAILLKLVDQKSYTIKDYNKSVLKFYSRSSSILTGPELVFYRVLRKHLNQSQIIATKVRLADFINVKEQKFHHKPKSITPNFNRVSSKHADFLICNLNGKPLVWIELDDKSHLSTKAKKADKFKDDIAASIGIPLYRVKVGTHYNDHVSRITRFL